MAGLGTILKCDPFDSVTTACLYGIIPLFGLITFVYLRKNKRYFVISPSFFLLTFFFLYMIITAVLKGDMFFLNGIGILSGLFLFLITYSDTKFDLKEVLKKLAEVTIIVSLIYAISGLFLFFCQHSGSSALHDLYLVINSYFNQNENERMIGIAGDPNALAIILTYGVICSHIYYLLGEKKIFKLLSLILIPLSHISIIFTASRTAIFSLGTFYILFLFFSCILIARNQIKPSLLITPFVVYIGLMLIFLLLSVLFLSNLSSHPLSMILDYVKERIIRPDTLKSASGRDIIYQNGFSILIQHPLRGYDTSNLYAEFGYPHFHNAFIQAFTDTGLPGGIAFLLFWVYSLYASFSNLVIHLKRKNDCVSELICFSVVFSALVAALFETYLFRNQFTPYTIPTFLAYASLINYEKRRLEYKKRWTKKIMGRIETLDYIERTGCSIGRYGDGELSLMAFFSLPFQKFSFDLRKELIEVSKSRDDSFLVCIPSFVGSTDEIANEDGKNFWERDLRWTTIIWKHFFGKSKVLGDTQITRPWMDFQNEESAALCFDKLKKIWDNQDIVIIEGEKTRLGLGNDLFENTKSISRILAPVQNAYIKIDEIYNAALTFPKDSLFLIALGPTATVLAYRLFKAGYRALDVGHMDVEYEWFKLRTPKRVPINNKAVWEAGGLSAFQEANIDNKYFEEVKKIIK